MRMYCRFICLSDSICIFRIFIHVPYCKYAFLLKKKCLVLSSPKISKHLDANLEYHIADALVKSPSCSGSHDSLPESTVPLKFTPSEPGTWARVRHWATLSENREIAQFCKRPCCNLRIGNSSSRLRRHWYQSKTDLSVNRQVKLNAPTFSNHNGL